MAVDSLLTGNRERYLNPCAPQKRLVSKLATGVGCLMAEVRDAMIDIDELS